MHLLFLGETNANMESTSPWKDERWLPGVLNYAQMTSLKKCGLILNSTGTIDRDASALDLHLSSEAYKMEKGSIKPFNKNYSDILNDGFYAAKLTTDSDGSFTLKVNECYVFKIAERLHPAITHDSPFYGQATAKSSIGRVDVIARLIVDGMKEYEKFSPKEISTGDMFLEITPITFDVKVKEGISISQLRFCNGDFEDSIIKDEKFLDSVLNLSSPSKNYGTLSVDVSNFKVSSSVTAAAYCAKSSAGKSIELWGENKYDPFEFWQPVQSQEIQSVKSITIIKNNFYILRSIERISLPEGVCIYCRAMDETLGEMRIHYAGFVHPLFGLKRTGIKGTPLIFEVRGHNVDVLLTQAEILARLIFYRMSTLAAEPKRKKVKSAQVQTSNVPYGEQELNLSKIFKKP